MARVIVHRRAASYLKRLPTQEKERIKSLLQQLEEAPMMLPGIRQMVGEWAGYYRIRVGNFRVIFWYDDAENVVYVDHIGPRGDVYK